MWDHVVVVALAAAALMLIGFSQTAGDARAFAAKHRYQVDINQESVAQAMANTGAGLLQGMPVSTSLSASSLNDRSGARTGLASLTSGVMVLLTLLVLAPLFSDLPKPVLAALIIEAVVMGMMDLPEMRRLFRVQRFDFWVAIAAIVGTLVFGVLAGVVIGIGLSLLWLVRVATAPGDRRCWAASPAPRSSASWASTPDDEQVPGVVVIRLDGGLFFATSDALEDRLRQVIHDDPGPDRDRPGLRGDQLHRLPGLGQAAGDRRARRGVRHHAAAGPPEGIGAADAEAGRRVRALRPRPHPRQRLPGGGGSARRSPPAPDSEPPSASTRSARSARAARRAAGRGR